MSDYQLKWDPKKLEYILYVNGVPTEETFVDFDEGIKILEEIKNQEHEEDVSE